MRILLLVQKEQRIILDRFYDSIVRHAGEGDVRWLSSEEQASLKRWFDGINTDAYDRIIFFLRFKKEIKQVRFIRSVPNLVILEHDAYQNYIQDKYRGKYSRHYRSLPWARIICSGFEVAQRLQGEGFDTVFVPKGYDQQLLNNRGLERDIELGFLGSIKSKTYDARRQLLEQLAEQENLLVKRTQSGEEYAEVLNRIRFFVSADVGMGEYMIKNFEAMACGCLVLACDQGEAENRALGFEDMKNIALYKDLDDLLEKIRYLRHHPEDAQRIASAGQQLVEQRYSWESLGATVAKALEPPLRHKQARRKLGIKHYHWKPPTST